jgi:hypothetical protein
MAKPERRDRAKERLWRARLSAWRRSGLDGRAFCRREGLSEPSFYAWRRELARRDRERGANTRSAVSASGGTDRRPQRATGATTFVPVAVEALATIDVVLPDNVLLRIGTGVDRRTLREVLAALAEARSAEARSAEARSAEARSAEARPC